MARKRADSPEFGTTALMDAMELAGNPLVELECFNIDVEQFLHLLPGTITDELAWGSYKDASPLRGVFNTTLLQKIATLLASDRVASLSPFAVREQLVAFLTSVDQWALARIADLPYLDRASDVGRLDQAVTVRVGVRKDSSNSQDPKGDEYVPPAARTDTNRESITWQQATERHRRLVVLADPGLGKTWLTYTQHPPARARCPRCARRWHPAGEERPVRTPRQRP